MKIKYLIFVLSVFTIFLSVSLLTGKETPLQIITSPKIYSLKHTELNETFKITVLMNRKDTYHLDKTYMRKSSIRSGDEMVPVRIDSIEVSRDKTVVNGIDYYLVNFVTSLAIESNDHLIEYEDAYLDLTYENEEQLELYIGEFNYLFNEEKADLSLYNLHGTFGEVEGINTVTGIVIELFNQSDNNITIKRVDILSDDVSFNNDYLVEKERDIDLFERVEEVLLIEDYNFNGYEQTEHHFTIYEGQMKQFYIPLLYNKEIKYISRFVISVTYDNNGNEAVYYIDDFIFMNRIHYGPNFEQGYHTYEIEN